MRCHSSNQRYLLDESDPHPHCTNQPDRAGGSGQWCQSTRVRTVAVTTSTNHAVRVPESRGMDRSNGTSQMRIASATNAMATLGHDHRHRGRRVDDPGARTSVRSNVRKTDPFCKLSSIHSMPIHASDSIGRLGITRAALVAHLSTSLRTEVRAPNSRTYTSSRTKVHGQSFHAFTKPALTGFPRM